MARNVKRIPIILDLLHANYLDFLLDIGIGDDNKIQLTNVFFVKKEEIQKFWEENPDLRLTQVLVNMDIIPNIPGTWYYTEEVDYVVERGWIKFEDINFWGVNYTADGKRLPSTVYKTLSEIDDQHVLAILKHFEDNSPIGRKGLPTKYLEYFENREQGIRHKEVDTLLGSLFTDFNG